LLSFVKREQALNEIFSAYPRFKIKHMKRFSLITPVLFILFLYSCNDKKAAVFENLSPNKKVQIKVVANRPSAVDAWKVEIKVKAYDFKEGYLAFEVYAGDLNDQNVKFDWKDDRNCIITVEQRDGEPRKFQLIADANQVQLGEI
jgi:hypothetical protein